MRFITNAEMNPQLYTNKYKKILFDLDGTILDRNGHMHPAVLTALRQAKDKISISFCTGKTPDFVSKLAQTIGLNTNHIVDDGSRVIDKDGKELWAVILPQEVIDYYLDLAQKYDFKIAATVDGKEKLNLTKADRHISRLFPYYLNNVQVKVLTLNIYSEKYEVKVVWYDERTGYNVSITDVNGNKKHGIKFLFQYEHLHKQEVIGVGDGINDLPMFEQVGFRVVMGNATDNVKAFADYIAPSVDQNGVVEILKKIKVLD